VDNVTRLKPARLASIEGCIDYMSHDSLDRLHILVYLETYKVKKTFQCYG
jgi:hypothetical protein